MAAGAGLLLLVICRAYGLIVVDLGDVRWSPMHKHCPAVHANNYNSVCPHPPMGLRGGGGEGEKSSVSAGYGHGGQS